MASSRVRRTRAKTATEDKTSRKAPAKAAIEDEQLSGGSSGDFDGRYGIRFEAPGAGDDVVREVVGYDERIVSAYRERASSASPERGRSSEQR
jgi:hypothetical protein